MTGSWKNPVAGKVVCITQARMTSTRLPGKILLTAAGKPLLQWHLERLQRCRLVDQVALATTENAADDPAAALAARLGVPVFRGSEHDVLGRFAGCAAACAADVVVRVTADCPLIDPELVDMVVARYAGSRDSEAALDYVCLDVGRFPRGLDAEVFPADLLALAAREAAESFEREHVTPFIYRRPERFRLGAPLGPDAAAPLGPDAAGPLVLNAAGAVIDGAAAARWCVDEAADLELVRRILGEVACDGDSRFSWRDCCMALSRHPEWMDINRDVAQKKLIDK